LNGASAIGKDIAFDLIGNEDGENTKLFTVQAVVDGEVMGLGKNSTKRMRRSWLPRRLARCWESD